MNKNAFQKVKLVKGEMNLYDFGGIRLHAYKTNDFIDDEVFLIEKDGKVAIIESPCFLDNNRELAQYIKDARLTVSGMLLAYHMAGATFLPEVPKYATHNADAYGHNGGGAALIQNFTNAFGEIFDGSIHTVTNFIEDGPLTLAGIRFMIHKTPDAFDIEIPEINAVYTHMLGHDCHSIVAGAAHADALIRQLQGYLDAGIGLVLTSHYTPEDLKDVQTKIDYLQELKALAAASKDKEAFQAAVKSKYPNYSGENYLDMTVGFFFS